MNQLDDVQQAALRLIREDARFLYSITKMYDSDVFGSHAMLMLAPYISMFSDGSEQWGRKAGMDSPVFTEEESAFHKKIRSSIKVFEKDYNAYSLELQTILDETDSYFYETTGKIMRHFRYYNVGTDCYSTNYCGNTVLCLSFFPMSINDLDKNSLIMKKMNIVSGKLAAFYIDPQQLQYSYDHSIRVQSKDYHFYKKCPLRLKNTLGLVLFSVLCNINFVTKYINDLFNEEIPQKFKFAYLQYYYLCNFLNSLRREEGCILEIDRELYNKELRNCIAHYGLKQYMTDNDLDLDDPLIGLTGKALGESYLDAKNHLYYILSNVCNQIKDIIF